MTHTHLTTDELVVVETYAKSINRLLKQLTRYYDVQDRPSILFFLSERWTSDVIVGRTKFSITLSVRTNYTLFQTGVFDCCDLPMKGKIKTKWTARKARETNS